MPLLSALKTVEDIYVREYLKNVEAGINKQELQNYITQSSATVSKYRVQIPDLQKEYNDTYATYTALLVQRTKAEAALQIAGETFQTEITNKLRTDAFLDGLEAIASIASASVPGLSQIGNISSKLRRHIACLSSQHLHRSFIALIAIISAVLQKSGVLLLG